MLKPFFREDNIVINFCGAVLIVTVGIWLIFCSGCASDWKGSSIPRPHQAEVIDLLWHQQLGHTDEFPFEMTFVEQWELECGGWGWKFDGDCVDGTTSTALDYKPPTSLDYKPMVMTLAWPDGMTWGASSVGHEFSHADAIVRKVAGGDHDHTTYYFCDPGVIGPCPSVPEQGTAKKLQTAVKEAKW